MINTQLTNGFIRNSIFLKQFIDGQPNELSLMRVGESNTIGWIIGHLITYRGKIIQTLGGECDVQEFEKLCERGAEKDKEFEIDIAAALELFTMRGGVIAELLEEETEKSLKEDIGRELPDGTSDIAGYLSFMAWHEGFHLGQLDLILAANGKGGIE